MADIISGPLAEPKDRRGLLRPEYSLDGGLSWQPWTGSQSIGDLAVGERVTVLLRGVVDPLTTGILTNVAQVSSPTPVSYTGLLSHAGPQSRQQYRHSGNPRDRAGRSIGGKSGRS